MSEQRFNTLREVSWRRKLTASEEAELRAWLESHPEAQADWQSEMALNEQLGRLPNAPISNNFTSRVLQAAERESAGTERKRRWEFSWQRFLPRAAVAAVFTVCLCVLFYGQHRSTQRAELAHNVAAVSRLASISDPAALQDFDIIYGLGDPSGPDRELLAHSWPLNFTATVGLPLPSLPAVRGDAALDPDAVEAGALKSPVEAFRKVLSMTVAERDHFLTNYPAATHERIIAKVQEYQILPEPYRELRLRTTELRWYLLPLLKMAGTNRQEQLKRIPEPYQKLISARLVEWDIWPTSLKEQILDYEDTMNQFVGWGSPVPPAPNMPSKQLTELEGKLARWQALPQGQRDQMYASFQHYFELSEEERQKTLDALSTLERQETEKVLDPMEKWGKPRQEKYMVAFQQFAGMTSQDRQQFLNNAERWRKMSETERQAWRDLVRQVPPIPPGARPGATIPLRTIPTTAPVR